MEVDTATYSKVSLGESKLHAIQDILQFLLKNVKDLTDSSDVR